MEFPASYYKLKYRERFFVKCYMNERLVEPQTHKPTFCNIFTSYVFSSNSKLDDVVEFRYDKVDGFGNIVRIEEWQPNCIVNANIKNVKRYMRIEENATKMYNKCIEAINDIRIILYESEDKSKVLELKEAIYNSALNGADFKDRNDNRKMAMKIFGLDQVKVDLDVDMYTASGKNILGRLKNGQNNDKEDAPIIPDVLEDIDIEE